MKLIKYDIYLNQLISRRKKWSHKGCYRNETLWKKVAFLNPESRKITSYLHDKIANKNEMSYILLDEIQFAISEKGREPIRLYGVHHI